LSFSASAARLAAAAGLAPAGLGDEPVLVDAVPAAGAAATGDALVSAAESRLQPLCKMPATKPVTIAAAEPTAEKRETMSDTGVLTKKITEPQWDGGGTFSFNERRASKVSTEY
jgi:hypothetical protein